jgi:hypothetical protein
MKTQNTYAILIVAIAAVSSGLTFQAIGLSEDAPAGTADKSGIFGHLTATLFDEDGYVKAYRQTDNRIVDTGLDVIADLVFGTGLTTSPSVIDIMAIGVSSAISAEGQTDLQDRTGLASCANATVTFVEGATGLGLVNVTDTVSFLGSAGCNAGIQEAGLFDVNNGNMFARQSFGLISVGASDQLDITWSIEINDDGNE